MKLIALTLLSATFAVANPVPATEEIASNDLDKRGALGAPGYCGPVGFGAGYGAGYGYGAANFFGPEFFTSNRAFENNLNKVDFNNDDHYRQSVEADQNTNLCATDANTYVADQTAKAIVKRDLELQRRGYPISGGYPYYPFDFPSIFDNRYFTYANTLSDVNFSDDSHFKQEVENDHDTDLHATNICTAANDNTALAVVKRNLMELQKRCNKKACKEYGYPYDYSNCDFPKYGFPSSKDYLDYFPSYNYFPGYDRYYPDYGRYYPGYDGKYKKDSKKCD
jgi:hypothetical protein